MSPHSVHVALGANLPSPAGLPLATIAAALSALDAEADVRVARVSSAWDTEPIGPPQPRFVNAVAELHTSLAPDELLQRLLAVEHRFGRDRSDGTRWGPRALDLDLLLVGESRLATPGLTVPHPRLSERAFVLAPLCEIAADACVPIADLVPMPTVRSLLEALPKPARAAVKRLGPIPFRSSRPSPEAPR